MNIDNVITYKKLRVVSDKIQVKIANRDGKSYVDKQIQKLKKSIGSDGDSVISRKGSILTIKSKQPVFFILSPYIKSNCIQKGVQYWIVISGNGVYKQIVLRIDISEFVCGFEENIQKTRSCLIDSVNAWMILLGADYRCPELVHEYNKEFIEKHTVKFHDKQTFRIELSLSERLKFLINDRKNEIDSLKSRGVTDEDVAHLNENLEIISIKEIRDEIKIIEKLLGDVDNKTLCLEYDVRAGDNHLYFVNTHEDDGFFTGLYKLQEQLRTNSLLTPCHPETNNLLFACQDTFMHLTHEDPLLIKLLINGKQIDIKKLKHEFGKIKRRKKVNL